MEVSLSEKKMFSLEELRSKLSEDFIAEFLNVCSECGSELRHTSDGLFSCTSCGREFNDGGEVEAGIPINEASSAEGHAESNYSPCVGLAFGKDMGVNSLMTRGAVVRVIATVKDRYGQGDVGIRADQIRIMTNKVEHPYLRSMLSLASRLCNDYGLHRDGQVCLVFAEDLARWVRRVGALSILHNDRHERKSGLVRACFFLLVGQYFPNLASKVREDLKVSNDDVGRVRFMISQYRLKAANSVDGDVVRCVRELFEAGSRFLRENGLDGDGGLCREFGLALWRCCLSAVVCGVDDREFLAKAVLALVAEKRLGKVKTLELMVKLGLSERLLGKAESLLS